MTNPPINVRPQQQLLISIAALQFFKCYAVGRVVRIDDRKRPSDRQSVNRWLSKRRHIDNPPISVDLSQATPSLRAHAVAGSTWRLALAPVLHSTTATKGYLNSTRIRPSVSIVA